MQFWGVLMSLVGKVEGAGEASGSGGLVNGVKVFELKKERKRKLDAAGEVAGDSVVRRRILRSDVAKQREKEAEEAKMKTLEESSVGGVRRKNSIDATFYVKDLKVQKQRLLRSNSGKKSKSGETRRGVLRDHLSNGTGEAREEVKSHLMKLTDEDAVDGDHQDGGLRTCENDVEAQDDGGITVLDAKQNEKADIEDERATSEYCSLENMVTEHADLEHVDRGIDCNDIVAELMKREEDGVVEKEDDAGWMKVSDNDTMGAGVGVAIEVGLNGEKSKPTISEGDGTEDKKFEEEITVEYKMNMDLDVVEQIKLDDADEEIKAEASSETGHKIRSTVRIRKKVKTRVENRRFTRSSIPKLMKEADTTTKEVRLAHTDKKIPTENVTSEAVQNENKCDMSNHTEIEIKEEIAESNNCKKNLDGREVEVEVQKRRTMKSDVGMQRDEADRSKKRKKSVEIGVKRKRGRPASGTGTNRKRSKTGSSRCKQDQSEDFVEGKKRMMASRKSCSLGSKEAVPIKRQKNGPNDKGVRSIRNGSRLEGAEVKWSKHSGRMILKNLKRNAGSPVGKTSSVKEEKSNETGIRPDSLSSCKKPKNVDTSCDRRDVMMKGASIASHLSNKEREAELRIARKKLRDQIKGMLLDAGWKIDLRRRKGKNYIDAVYIAPNGCTHWSIVKAYYALVKKFSCEHGDKGEHSSEKPQKKSQKSKTPSFTPIPEEVLSILKHPISKRRTNKEIAEAKMNPGDESTSKKEKKRVTYLKAKYSQKNGELRKGRAKKGRIVGLGAKGAVISAGKKRLHLGKHRKKQKGCSLLVRSYNQDAETSTDVYVPYAWKRTVLSWMIDLGIIPENAAVKYMNRRRTKALLNGQIIRDGIRCSCCSKIFTVAEFEIHAGSKQSNPHQNIIVEEVGTSLSQCQINAWETQDVSQRRDFYTIDIHGDDPNDDTCGICGDGGELICCDGCPSTFHQSCLGSETLPPGDWYCRNCLCRYCALHSGISSQGNGVNDSPLLSCSQCEEKYHQTCVPEEDAVTVSSSRSCSSFCGQNCNMLFGKLRTLLGVKNYLDAGFSWTVIQRFNEDLPESVCTLDQRAECNSKIAVALAVMDECFLPIIDKRSGFNLIHNVVYNCGSNFSRLNYSGFYTFVLERNDEIISVASLRIHGTRVAEMPFIGTRNMYRRQGMCRRLLNEIESILRTLNIQKLIIPAISALKKTWTNVFGFKLLEVSEKEEIKSINLLVFPGTGLLVKPLLGKDSVEHCKTADKVDQLEPESMCPTPEAVNEFVLPANDELDPHASGVVFAQHKSAVEHLEPSFSISGSCMGSHLNVSAKSSDAHVKIQVPDLKSSEVDAHNDLSLHPVSVSHDEPVTKINFQKCSSLELQTELICKDAVHEDDSVVSKLLPADDTLE